MEAFIIGSEAKVELAKFIASCKTYSYEYCGNTIEVNEQIRVAQYSDVEEIILPGTQETFSVECLDGQILISGLNLVCFGETNHLAEWAILNRDVFERYDIQLEYSICSEDIPGAYKAARRLLMRYDVGPIELSLDPDNYVSLKDFDAATNSAHKIYLACDHYDFVFAAVAFDYSSVKKVVFDEDVRPSEDMLMRYTLMFPNAFI